MKNEFKKRKGKK